MIILTILFVILCMTLILFILLQSNRSSGMGLFTSSETAFGASSTDILTKITGWMVGIFLILALLIAFLKVKSNAASLEDIVTEPTINNSITNTQQNSDNDNINQDTSSLINQPTKDATQQENPNNKKDK